MVSTGKLLLQASDEERVAEMTAIAVGRKNNVTKSEVAELLDVGDLDSLATLTLPPGGIQRLRDWQELYHEKLAESPSCEHSYAMWIILLVVKVPVVECWVGNWKG